MCNLWGQGQGYNPHTKFKTKINNNKKPHRKPHGFNLYFETPMYYTTSVCVSYKSIKGGQEIKEKQLRLCVSLLGGSIVFLFK